jgi:hypothetical protein
MNPPDSIISARPAPRLRFEFRASMLLSPPLEFGFIEGVRKRIVPIVGGTLLGPRIRGEILNVGGDWEFVLSDGVAFMNMPYVLRTSDQTLISVAHTGIRRSPRPIPEEPGASTSYYCRVTPRFDAPNGPYQWLRENFFVGVATRRDDSADIDYFAVD